MSSIAMPESVLPEARFINTISNALEQQQLDNAEVPSDDSIGMNSHRELELPHTKGTTNTTYAASHAMGPSGVLSLSGHHNR